MKKFNLLLAAIVLAAFSFNLSFEVGSAQAAGGGHPHIVVAGYPQTRHANAALYDPNDPHDSGCASGAYVAGVEHIYDNNMLLATVENWYSPNCVKNWGQIEWTLGTALITNIETTSNDYVREQCYPIDCSSGYAGGLSPSWTDMVDGHNIICVTALVTYKGLFYYPNDGNRKQGGPYQTYIYVCE